MVDDAGGIDGRGVAPHFPSPHLILADGEEGLQPHQVVAEANDAVEA